MLPRIESCIQVIRGLRVILDVDLAALYEVASCNHLLNLIAPTEPGMRPIGFLTYGDTKTPKASRMTKGW